MFVIDKYPISSSYYHSPYDTVAHLDLGSLTAAVQIAGAALVELSSP